MTKADLIREYLAKFPQMGPTKLANKIMQENRGFVIRGQEISNLKGKPRPAVQTIAQAVVATPPAVSNNAPDPKEDSMADRITQLREAAEAVGGIEEAKKILDLLK
jgi:hypothetical protein